MLLDSLLTRNPAFVREAIAMHRRGGIPPVCHVLDLDGVSENAAMLRAAAEGHGVELFAMTKQVARGPSFLAAIRAAGIRCGVAVDMDCVRALRRGGLEIGNVGHLVQVPRTEARAAAALRPANWTVLSIEKAKQAGEAAAAEGYEQPVLLRVQSPGDVVVPGVEGGFGPDQVVNAAETIDRLEGARFAGLTSHPALRFDARSGRMMPAPNLDTLTAATERLRAAGRAQARLRINAAGHASTDLVGMLAERGVTQVEPGHALTGTTPLHGVRELPERPAALYVSEVSHRHGNSCFVFGGGLTIMPSSAGSRMRALVAPSPDLDGATLVDAEISPGRGVDYYGRIDAPDPRVARVGDTVVFCLRMQAFATRAPVAGLAGLDVGHPRVEGIWTADGTPATWPGAGHVVASPS
jgi:predicted amino acid racemase